MHTDFLPTRKIPVSQLYAWNSQRAFPLEITLNHRGCVIRDQASGTEFLASTDDEGFIRGATLLGETRDHLVYLMLSDMTGCEWVNEYSEQWPLYRCWTEAERDTHARKVAADLADDRAEAEGIPVREAFEVEYQAIYEMHPVTIENWQVAA
ncbi:MAG: hypothetical protein GKS01_00460 [Alphaproteobacteria bacterium]|nr:hypothetical protein [Alphaproteobacteria bacterium]